MEQGRIVGNNSNVQMTATKTIETYKAFEIKYYGGYKISITYPDGNVSPIAFGSIEAARRIIDTYLSKIKYSNN